MIRLHQVTRLIASAGMLLLLAGCLQSTTSSRSKVSHSGLNATPGTAQLVKTGIVPTNVPLHPSPMPTAPVPLNGNVTLQIIVVPQHASDSIALILKNSTNQTILFSDHLTECSVVLLQMQPPSAAGSGIWQAVAPCGVEIATRLHTLEARKTLTLSFVPSNGRWPSGLYRGQLNYILSSANHRPQTIFSSSFHVG